MIRIKYEEIRVFEIVVYKVGQECNVLHSVTDIYRSENTHAHTQNAQARAHTYDMVAAV